MLKRISALTLVVFFLTIIMGVSTVQAQTPIPVPTPSPITAVGFEEGINSDGKAVITPFLRYEGDEFYRTCTYVTWETIQSEESGIYGILNRTLERSMSFYSSGDSQKAFPYSPPFSESLLQKWDDMGERFFSLMLSCGEEEVPWVVTYSWKQRQIIEESNKLYDSPTYSKLLEWGIYGPDEVDIWPVMSLDQRSMVYIIGPEEEVAACQIEVAATMDPLPGIWVRDHRPRDTSYVHLVSYDIPVDWTYIVYRKTCDGQYMIVDQQHKITTSLSNLPSPERDYFDKLLSSTPEGQLAFKNLQKGLKLHLPNNVVYSGSGVVTIPLSSTESITKPVWLVMEVGGTEYKAVVYPQEVVSSFVISPSLDLYRGTLILPNLYGGDEIEREEVRIISDRDLYGFYGYDRITHYVRPGQELSFSVPIQNLYDGGDVVPDPIGANLIFEFFLGGIQVFTQSVPITPGSIPLDEVKDVSGEIILNVDPGKYSLIVKLGRYEFTREIVVLSPIEAQITSINFDSQEVAIVTITFESLFAETQPLTLSLQFPGGGITQTTTFLGDGSNKLVYTTTLSGYVVPEVGCGELVVTVFYTDGHQSETAPIEGCFVADNRAYLPIVVR